MYFEPTKKQVEAFVQRLENLFKELRKTVEAGQKKRLDQFYQEFEKAQTVDEYNDIRQKVMDEFRIFAWGRGFFIPPLRGPEAGAGIYKLELTQGGQVISGLLTIRDDPMLQK